jgi:hypothetical protein
MTAFTTEKTAVLAPIPSARERMAIVVNAGVQEDTQGIAQVLRESSEHGVTISHRNL